MFHWIFKRRTANLGYISDFGEFVVNPPVMFVRFLVAETDLGDLRQCLGGKTSFRLSIVVVAH